MSLTIYITSPVLLPLRKIWIIIIGCGMPDYVVLMVIIFITNVLNLFALLFSALIGLGVSRLDKPNPVKLDDFVCSHS